MIGDVQHARRLRRRALLLGALTYFGIVFGAGFLLGAIRVPFLVPRWGERVAELAEMPIMFVVLFVAAGFVVRRFGAFLTRFAMLFLGAVSLAFLLAAELLLAVVLAGRSVREYVASRDPVSGSVYLAMLAVFAILPWVRFPRTAGRSG